MKTNALNRYKFSAEHYDFVEKKIGAESENLFFFNENVQISFLSDRVGRIIIYSPTEFKVGSYLLNLKDIDGKGFLSNSRWDITSANPMVDAFGKIINYKYTVSRTII